MVELLPNVQSSQRPKRAPWPALPLGAEQGERCHDLVAVAMERGPGGAGRLGRAGRGAVAVSATEFAVPAFGAAHAAGEHGSITAAPNQYRRHDADGDSGARAGGCQ